MNFPYSRFKIFTAFLFFAALLYSCTKIITTDIGSDLLPPVDAITTKDTVIEIATKNTGYDTIAVGISDDHVLGYINDPLFGKTTASVNFQVAPATVPLSFGISRDSIIMDSVVLCLKYTSTWGDTLPHLKLHVYSMDPEVVFDNDVVYNNTKTFAKGPELTENNIAKDVDITKLNDIDTTKGVYTEVATNQIRIRLNKSLGETILGLDSSTFYTSDSSFYNGLRGLIIEPETTGHALISINLTDTTTRLALYYHRENGGDTLTRRFIPNVLTSASSNRIERNREGTQIPSYVNSADSNQDLVFMQTSPGTRALINISKLQTMPNVIVHRAEILMYQVPDASDEYLRPPNLFLSAYNSDSARTFAIPNDIIFTGNTINNLAQFGVAPKQKDGAYYYSFDISRYVQGIVTRKDKIYNLQLAAPYNQYIYTDSSFRYVVPISSPALNTVAVGRIRLGGGNNSQYKMRLHIVYSLP
jgi:hypothetical protein